MFDLFKVIRNQGYQAIPDLRKAESIFRSGPPVHKGKGLP